MVKKQGTAAVENGKDICEEKIKLDVAVNLVVSLAIYTTPLYQHFAILTQ